MSFVCESECTENHTLYVCELSYGLVNVVFLNMLFSNDSYDRSSVIFVEVHLKSIRAYQCYK